MFAFFTVTKDSHLHTYTSPNRFWNLFVSIKTHNSLVTVDHHIIKLENKAAPSLWPQKAKAPTQRRRAPAGTAHRHGTSRTVNRTDAFDDDSALPRVTRVRQLRILRRVIIVSAE